MCTVKAAHFIMHFALGWCSNMDELLTTSAEEASAVQEQNPRLVNVTTMDKALYLESAAAMGKRWKGRIFSVLAMVCAVYGLIIHRWIVVALALLIAVLALFSHVIMAYRDFGKLKRRHGADHWDKTIRFFDDHLESFSGGGAPSVLPYRRIRREYETEHMYVLDFGSAAPAMTFAKDGFTLGSFEEMKNWLLERQRASYDQPQDFDED